ncbi:TPA: hypothetical protein DIC62_01480 [Candidatus Nomurabacteria bacterium]|nr:hypothetical protein [Candidatus Nomurabacteria bacterium]
MSEENRELTYGEKAVGLTFNPSGDDGVKRVKELYAEIINIMDDFRKVEAANMTTGEHKRLASVAITEAQTAQMWAVKALTWRDPIEEDVASNR